jgi:hypothetical protein
VIVSNERDSVWIDRIGGGLLIALLVGGAILGANVFGTGRADFLIFVIFPVILVWLIWNKLVSHPKQPDDDVSP